MPHLPALPRNQTTVAVVKCQILIGGGGTGGGSGGGGGGAGCRSSIRF